MLIQQNNKRVVNSHYFIYCKYISLVVELPRVNNNSKQDIVSIQTPLLEIKQDVVSIQTPLLEMKQDVVSIQTPLLIVKQYLYGNKKKDYHNG